MDGNDCTLDYYSQRFSISFDRDSCLTLQSFSHQGRKAKLSILVKDQTVAILRSTLCMESRGLSQCIFISKNVTSMIFETSGTVCSTHKISDNRPVSVASTQRQSMAHGKLPFSGTISPSVCAFSLAVKCGFCVELDIRR